jgi:predicted transcriptional regulator
MQGFVKVKDKDGLVRDLSSGAIINNNASEYQNYIKKRNAAQQLRKDLDKQSEEINNIKSDISEIKELLITLINKS